MTKVKLLDDCDILKDNLTLNDSVGLIADRFECISYIQLQLKIAGMEMKTWTNKGLPYMGDVSFENPLRDRKQRVIVSVTAIPYHAQETFTSKFTLDPTNCSAEAVTMKSTYINTTTTVTTTTTTKTTNTTTTTTTSATATRNSTLVVCTITIILTLCTSAIVIAICWKSNKGARPEENVDIEENLTYGTYSRGHDEDGEYGDGDKVYIHDTNAYYADN